MIEGEFYKRLRELVGTGSIIYNEDVIFREWLNEAKKEFPSILQNRKGDPWVNPEKAAIWFLKYFGE